MKEKIESIKFVIGRYDTYIESTQSKSNLYLALNTAIVGGIITLLTSSRADDLAHAVAIILGIIGLLALGSIVLTLLAVTPYLDSEESKAKSLLFFRDVADIRYETYHDKFEGISEGKFFKDLTCQAYSLASGLKGKYQKLMYAGRLLILEFILLFACIIVFISQTI